MTFEELAIKAQATEDRSKSNTKRLEKVEEQLSDNAEMLASIARLDQRQKDMDTDIKEMKADVKTLTGKSGKRWDAIVDKALLLVVAAVVTYMLSKLGL